MVERILFSPPLHGWTLRWCPGPRVGLAASHCLQAASSTTEKDSSWTAPPCLGMLGHRDYLPPKDFMRTRDYLEVWHEEMVALARALQRCSIHSGMLTGMLCRAVQEPCRCLTPWLRVVTKLILRCWMWQRGTPWSLPLQRVPLLQNLEHKNQPVYPTPASQPLWSQRRLYDQRISPLCQDEDHCHPLGLPFHGQMSLAYPLQSKWTGPQAYPWEPNWVLPPWSPCKWPYHITQQWAKHNLSTSPRPLPWCPWPRCPYLWPCPNCQTNLTPLHGLRSSE